MGGNLLGGIVTFTQQGARKALTGAPLALLAIGALSIGAVATTATMAGAASPAAPSDSTEVFSNFPAAPAKTYLSQGFEAEKTLELGDLVALDGEDRMLDGVTVNFTDWACETGQWSLGTCETTEGATFTHPITVTVYAADEADAIPTVGDELASVTQSVTVPYRPSADPVNCTADTKKWYDEDSDNCYSGLAFSAYFDLAASDVELPEHVIVAVGYDTSSSNGDLAAGGDYDFLNVSVTQDAASVGADVDEAKLFLSSNVGSKYTDGGAAGTGFLRYDVLDQGDPAAGYSPMISVHAHSPAVTPTPTPTPSVTPTSDPTPTAEPTPGAPQPGDTITAASTIGETNVSVDAILGDDPSGELFLKREHTTDLASFGALPADASFPYGALSFELNVQTGSTATVTIMTEQPVNALYKSMGDSWSPYEATFTGTSVTFTLVDGGVGDADGVANGVIVDPVAPALEVAFTG